MAIPVDKSLLLNPEVTCFLRGALLNSKYVLHNACVDVPFPFKEGGGNGGVLHNAHENGQHIFTI